MFDCNLSFDAQVKGVVESCFLHCKIRSFLCSTDLEKGVHAFISSRLLYCNSIYSCLSQSSVLIAVESKCSSKELNQNVIDYVIIIIIITLFLLSFRLQTLLCVIIPVKTITTKMSPPTRCAASQFFSQSPLQVCVRCASAQHDRAWPAPLYAARSPPRLREETCCSPISDTAAYTNYLLPCP